MDHTVVERATSEILDEILGKGWQETEKGMLDTPKRVAKMMAELTSGYKEANGKDVLSATFFDDVIQEYDGMVVIKNIPFWSMCEHHMAPFFGTVDIGYVPNGKVAGLSKFSRLVEIYARRLQVQERLTIQIAEDIMTYLEPVGCGVVVRGIHTCMCMRGAKAHGSSTITPIMRGCFFGNTACRMEFLSYINNIN